METERQSSLQPAAAAAAASESITASSSSSPSSFTSAMALTESAMLSVPQRYVLPPLDRPQPCLPTATHLPIVDLSSFYHPSRRPRVISEIRRACQEFGFFQVINHGIPLSLMKDAIDAAIDFFSLPNEEKMLLMSDDVHAPVRYGTSLNHAIDKVHYWRDFIKHYSHPVSKWIHLWPTNPPTYREKIGKYAEATQLLQKQLTEAVLESLGLNPTYLEDKVQAEEGSQLLAVNCYPQCPEPELALGMPPHTDFGSLTILLQSCPGLQIMDPVCNEWLPVPSVEGGLVVQLGDQIEVMSNGKYKSVVHRATVSVERQRISIASLHSLALNRKIGPAPELVNEECPASYNEFSLSDFLDYLSNNDVIENRFIDTLKRNP